MTMALTLEGIPRSGQTNNRAVAASTAMTMTASAATSLRQRHPRGDRTP